MVFRYCGITAIAAKGLTEPVYILLFLRTLLLFASADQGLDAAAMGGHNRFGRTGPHANAFDE